MLTFLISSNSLVISQEIDESINPRMDKRFGLALKGGGAWGIIGGISADFFITPEINMELDYLPVPMLSSIQYVGGGINMHPLGGREELEFSPYIGVFYGHAEGKAFLSGAHEEWNSINVPVGLLYTNNIKRIGFGIEIGLGWKREYAEAAPKGYRDDFFPTPSAKLRWGF